MDEEIHILSVIFCLKSLFFFSFLLNIHPCTQSLPESLSLATASQVMEFARNQPNFSRLGKLCENFVKNTKFQHELAGLVREMHDALNQTLLIFGGKTFDEEGREKTPRSKEVGKALVRNPAKLSSSIKQAFSNFLLLGLKMLQFCEKFVKFRCNLSRQDLNAVFLYAKAQLPIFFSQIIELYKSFKYATVELDARKSENSRYPMLSKSVVRSETRHRLLRHPGG